MSFDVRNNFLLAFRALVFKDKIWATEEKCSATAININFVITFILYKREKYTYQQVV